MPLSFDRLEALLTPDGTGRIQVAATAFETHAVTTLWETAFFPTSGILSLTQADSVPDVLSGRVTVSGLLAPGTVPGMDAGRLTSGAFTLQHDGSVAARLEISAGDPDWTLSRTFPSLAGSILDELTFSAPRLTVDSTAPEVLPPDFRARFGDPPDIPAVAERLVAGLSFEATVSAVGEAALLAAAAVRLPALARGPISLWYFAGDEYDPSPSLYPQMLLTLGEGARRSWSIGEARFEFGMEIASVFTEIATDRPEDYAVLPTGVVALRCEFTPSGWARPIPVSAYLFAETADTLRLEVGEGYVRTAGRDQLPSLLNGADLAPILNPGHGFPVFDSLTLRYASVDLATAPLALESVSVAFQIVSSPWVLFGGLIVVDSLGFSIRASDVDGSWAAAGNVFASARFAPECNADVILSAYVSIPEFYFQLQLEATSKTMDLLAPVRRLVGDSIPLPTLTGTTFSAWGNVTESAYTFQADIVEHWELVGGSNGLVLTGMNVQLTSSSAGVSGQVLGRFTLGAVGISVSASYTPTGGWVFSGKSVPGKPPSLTQLVRDLASHFGWSTPAGFPQIDLTALSVEYSASDKRMVVDAALAFAGLSVDLTQLPLVGEHLSPEDSISLSGVSLNVDTGGATTVTFEVLFGGQPQEIVLSFGGSQSSGRTAEPAAPLPAQTDPLLRPAANPPGITATSPAGTWLDVQKTFGPLSVRRIGFRLNGNAVEVMFDASLAFTAFEADVTGLGVLVPLQAPYVPRFDIGGLAIRYTSPSVSIAGAFLKTDTGDHLEFSGELSVRAGRFALSALGSYASRPASLFAFVMVHAPIGGPPYFYVNGLSGGFGYNRNLLLPSIDRVADFPLVAGARTTGNPFGTSPSLGRAMQVMDGYLGSAPGENWLAVGISVSSFGMVSVQALLSVAFGARFQVGLLGVGTLAVPAGRADPVIYAQLAMEALLIPSQGVAAVYAQLTPDSYVFERACKLTGGFAFSLWFTPTDPALPAAQNHAGDFVVTLGGYHPSFTPPSHYPAVPPLGMSWTVSSELSIKGGLYFALVPHALMAGGRLDATWDSGPIHVSFSVHADFLIQWKPFHYDIALGVSFSVRASVEIAFVRVSIAVSVGAELHIWGPPFKYRARIDLAVLHFTIGSGDDDSRPPAIGWQEFHDSFLAPSGGSASHAAAPDQMAASFLQRPAVRTPRRAPPPGPPAPALVVTAAADGGCSTAARAVHDASPVIAVAINDGVLQDLTRSVAAVAVHPDPGNRSETVRVPIDYLVDPQHFRLTTQSLVPAKALSYNGVHWTPVTWTTEFGIGPMQLDPSGVNSTHEVTVCRLTDLQPYGGFTPRPVLVRVPKAVWLHQPDLGRALNEGTLLDDCLQGLELRPEIVTPTHSVPVDVATLESEVEATRTVAWGTDPAPATDPFGGLDPDTTLAETIGGAAAEARSPILADLVRNGFALGSYIDTRPMQDATRLELLGSVVLASLGEAKDFGPMLS